MTPLKKPIEQKGDFGSCVKKVPAIGCRQKFLMRKARSQRMARKKEELRNPYRRKEILSTAKVIYAAQ